MMIDLHLLGGLTIDGPGPAPGAASRRRHPLALLALVAEAAPQAMGRDRIMALLWPESDAERASNSLRQTLFRLRRELGEDLFLPESAAGVQLDPARVSVDLWKFRDAISRQAPADAVAAYGGPFLDGFHIPGLLDFSRWVEGEREGLARDYLEALEALARRAEEEARHADAVSWRRRQATEDPYSSRVALALIKALAAAGDRPGAIEHAGAYEELVRQHLEIDPDPVVTDFVRSLRQSPPAREASRSPDDPGPSPEERREIPTPAPSDPAGGPGPTPTPGSPDREHASSRPWLIGAALLAGLGFLATRLTISEEGDDDPGNPTAAGTVVVVGSAVENVGGRDPANRLVACDGPACPTGSLPQDAYVVPKHGAYAAPVAGTGYIAPVPDGTTRAPPGYTCCTTATFENEFTLPPDAVTARISTSVLADNQAMVSINGVEFGRQPEREDPSNYAGPPRTFSLTFPPDPSGTNRLQVTVWNGGGAVGLQYHAVVTYEIVPDGD